MAAPHFIVPAPSASSTPFLIVPASLPISQPRQPARPSFLSAALSSAQSSQYDPQQQQQQQSSAAAPRNLVVYRAPAHKHAHHLHTIPPREKTTRTLIIDHMLYLHSLARLEQARLQLGMPSVDLSSPFPEGDGESVQALMFGVRGYERLKGYSVDANQYVPKINMAASSKKKATAEGVERVLSSMIAQSNNRRTLENQQGKKVDQPKLPNGVRYRLALSILINDFFAYGDGVYEQSIYPEAPSTEYPMSISSILATPPTPTMHPSVALLSPISSFSLSGSSGRNGSSRPPPPPPPPDSIFTSIPRGAGPESPWALGGMKSSSSTSSSKPLSSSSASHLEHGPRVWKAIGPSRDLYNAGVRPKSEICSHHLLYVEFCPPHCPTVLRRSGSFPHGRPASVTSSIGAGLRAAIPPLRRTRKDSVGGVRIIDMLPLFLRFSALVAREIGREMGPEDRLDESSVPNVAPSTTGDARPNQEWYALLSGLVTRAALEGYLAEDGWKGPETIEVLFGLGIGVDWNFTPPSSLPRRAPRKKHRVDHGPYGIAPPQLEDDSSSSDQSDEEEDDLPETPQSEAYAPDGLPSIFNAAKILFHRGVPTSSPSTGAEGNGVGGGSSAGTTSSRSAPRPPPSRHESAFGLNITPTPWGSGTGLNRPGTGLGDSEWEWEMTERISEFVSLSPQTPDLSFHLQELSKRYPPEPVERALVRFFEALVAWGGTPELEMYKMRNAQASAARAPATSPANLFSSTSTPFTSSTDASVPFDASAYLNPDPAAPSDTTPPAPSKPRHPIFNYFYLPPLAKSTTPASSSSPSSGFSRKRSRLPDDEPLDTPLGIGKSKGKKPASFVPEVEVEQDWTGPYGL